MPLLKKDTVSLDEDLPVSYKSRPVVKSGIIALLLVASVSYIALSSPVSASTWLRYGNSSPPGGLGPQIWPADADIAPSVNDEDAMEEAERIRDFAQYRWHRDLAWDPTGTGRLIVIGDIHGMVKPFRDLLSAISFDNESDTLVLIGDLVAKASSIDDSVSVVSLARRIGAHAVRGNHDDRTIKFRLWQEWNAGAFDTDSWLTAASEPSTLPEKLPKGWRWRSDHFEIARRLPTKDFDWLLHRSLTLHLKPLHLFFVHAGLLPTLVPKHASSSKDEHDVADDLESTSPYEFEPSPRTEQRMTAEDAVLLRKQNRKPSTLMEMRGVTQNGTRPRSDGRVGRPWSSIWNEAMAECERQAECQPLDVLYGHWAHRGLQVERHSIGLDSGCVYGRQLSALVLAGDRCSLQEAQYAPSLVKREMHLSGRKGVVYSLDCT